MTTEAGLAVLLSAVTETRSKYPFTSIAWVILPDHLHYIWQLPEGDSDFSTRWNLIKGRFTRGYLKANGHVRGMPSYSRQRHREQNVWQRRFWEHCIRDDNDLRRHINYIRYNPVKHGYVTEPLLWHHSSGHRAEYREALTCIKPELAELELDGVE